MSTIGIKLHAGVSVVTMRLHCRSVSSRPASGRFADADRQGCRLFEGSKRVVDATSVL